MLNSITNLAQISQIRILNFLNQSNLITVNIHVIWKTLRMLIQASLGIIWKTLGLVSKLSTNSQLGSNKLNETKSFQLNFESFRNPE
jgi:hypothetical protein